MSVQYLSPRQAARAAGVSESTLKRWCDRGLLEVVRTAGGHRKIPLGEVVHLARGLVQPDASPSNLLPRLGLENNVVDPFVEALLRGDAITARQLVIDAFQNGMPVSSLCDEIIASAFGTIGELWSCQRADVYQERRGCEITLRILHELIGLQRPPLDHVSAIGGSLEGDHYVLPSAMVEAVLRSARFQVQNLGTSLPVDTLVRAIRDLRPTIFWVSLTHVDDPSRLQRGMADLMTACEETHTALVVGGRALTSDIRRRITFTAHGDTMRHLETFATNLRGVSRATKAAARHTSASRRTRRKP